MSGDVSEVVAAQSERNAPLNHSLRMRSAVSPLRPRHVPGNHGMLLHRLLELLQGSHLHAADLDVCGVHIFALMGLALKLKLQNSEFKDSGCCSLGRTKKEAQAI